MKKHLVKGSIEAKKYMAKLRAKRTVGSAKKKSVKKAAPKKVVKKATPKKSSLHKDTKSHNVNIRVVSGIKKHSNVTNSQILREDLKQQKLRLKHGYDLVKRITGLFDTTIITDLDSLKKQYYKLAKIYHPDAGGTTSQFQELENEYNKLFKKVLSGSNLSEEQKKNEIELDENLSKALMAIISLPGINIELVGKWIWVSGLTFPIKAELRSSGFEWAPKKKMWYYAGVESAGRGKSTIEEIRAKYGSEKINKKDFPSLNGVVHTLSPVKRSKLKLYLKKAVKNLNKRPI
jgi:hypothetical protein